MTNKTNELMQIGLRLGGCRQDRNMTQEELAGRLGITPQAVSKWERCISLPDISMLSDLARLLEVSTDWLLGLNTQRGAGAGWPDKAAGASAQTGQVQAEMGSCLRGSLEPLELAFGVGLVPAFMGEASQAEGGSFVEQIRHMKVRLAGEGIWTPIVRVRDLSSLGETEFAVLSFHNILYSEVLDSADAGALDYMLGRLEETIRNSYHEILYPDLTKDLVDNLKIRYPALIEGIVPEKISYGLLTETAKIVLAGGIRPCLFPKIIELLECALRRSPDAAPEELAEDILIRMKQEKAMTSAE